MTPREADRRIVAAIETTGGKMPMDVLGRDEAEVAMLREAAKHHRGTKSLTIRVATTDERQALERWQGRDP